LMDMREEAAPRAAPAAESAGRRRAA
jgi:hypothetical protein